MSSAKREHLPNRRDNFSFSFEFEQHRYRATAGHFPDGRLAEIFLDTEKAGTPLQQNAETSAILASLALQHGVHVDTVRHSVRGPISVALNYFSKISALAKSGQ
jgi:hypothetical protein